MRIVAGAWRGRRLAAPKGRDTRPTSDRVREALFDMLTSMLGADLGGASVLDAFAGSGALGFEALSRGARHVTFLESARAAREAILENAASLGAADRATLVAADALSPALAQRLPGAPFDLLVADPPYRIEPARLASWLQVLVNAGALAEGAVVVYEHAAGTPFDWPAGFESMKERGYGATEISVGAYRGEDRP